MVPDFFRDILLQEYGEETSYKIIEGYSKERFTTLRVNRLKSNIDTIKNILSNNNIKYREVDWNSDALIIENVKESDMQKLEIYENGEIYLQSLASMLPPIILNPCEKESILDMAAAPGGKTTQMASMSNGLAMITACEKNKVRAERLKYNLSKQGAGRVSLIIEDARKLNDFFSFDKILLDAPCSGSGTETVKEKNFTQELIDRSVKTQKELLKKALKIVKKGGTIVYSTCSILKEENENIIKDIIAKGNVEIVPIDVKEFASIPLLPVDIEGVLCVCPTELYEGFFVAQLRRKG